MKVAPRLPNRYERRQMLRRYRLSGDWKRARGEECDAVLGFALHLHFREHQDEHPAYENGNETILTPKWMKGLLREMGARKRGEKAARRAIRFLIESGVIEDTGRTMKPKRSAQAIARAEKFQKRQGQRAPSSAPTDGGRTAQPTRLHSYWWRVLRIAPRVLPRALAAVLGKAPARDQRSLSAREVCQEEISSPRRRSRPNPGSVRWALSHSGPP